MQHEHAIPSDDHSSRSAARPIGNERAQPLSSAARRWRCIFRLILLSILVGVILEVLGLDPLEHHREPAAT